MTVVAERPVAADQCVGSNHRPGCEHFPAAAAAKLEQLPLDLVDVGANVRVDPGELEELAATIREHGVLQAVSAVGPDATGRYSLVAGQRRFLASRLAGLTTVPAVVRASADAAKPGVRRSLEQLIENIQRADLNDVDEAKALTAILSADPTLTQVALAKRLGRSAPWIANTLALLRADKKVQALVAEGKLSAAHARAIGGLAHVDQVELAEKAVKNGQSAHDLEREAKWAKENAKGRAAERERMAKLAALSIAALEKSAAKDATIAVRNGAEVAKAIRAAGWTDVRTDLGYSAVEAVKQAGACGCKAWLVEGWQGAQVTPACIDKDHIAARKKEQDAVWARQRVEDEKRRAAEDLSRARRAEGIGTWLAGVIDGPLGRRLMLYALVDGEDENLVERYLSGDEQAKDDRDTDADELWHAVLAVPDDKLALELGTAAGERLLGWGASKEVLALVDAALPPAPAKPAKAKKAKVAER